MESQQPVSNPIIHGREYFPKKPVVSIITGGLQTLPAILMTIRKKIINALKEVYGQLISKSNMLQEPYATEPISRPIQPNLNHSPDRLSEKPIVKHEWKLEPVSINEGIMTTSKVQYVLQGFDYRKLGLKWNGKWHVLNQIMSTDWLQTQIRVIGGAYGGFSNISKNGSITLASYRDPNLRETLENFKGTANYLARFEADSAAMTRYIIGTIANLDNPLTPSEKGEQAFRWYFEEVDREEVQSDRNDVLATRCCGYQEYERIHRQNY